MTLPLFDAPAPFDRAALGRTLRALAEENIWIGTSSWKYEGWIGQIYSQERYTVRGRFSRRRFEDDCLAEYAETFPTVCGDFSFYQFPSPQYWQKLFAAAPPQLRIALKVPEEVTAEVFPKHARYGVRAGMKNASYLDAATLQALFLEPLGPYRGRLGPLVFEFGARGTPLGEFVQGLDAFLAQLPPTFHYAVEVRNRDYLRPLYFDCLRAHRAAHVLNSWTRMPALGEQMAAPGVFTAGFTVVRALLRPGRAYEEAVRAFQPYSQVQEENPEVRNALRALIERMKQERRAAYIYVNNRLEGNAPETIRAVVAD